jgi:hypothetical protein
MGGLAIKHFYKKFGKALYVLVLANLIYESLMFIKYNTSHGLGSLSFKYIIQNDPKPHSAYFFYKFDSPVYSWMH